MGIYASELVIQLPVGSGGSKTFLYNERTHKKIDQLIQKESTYSVSIYQRDNVPYNIHCIIFDENIEVFFPSKQLLEISELIEYIGSEFETNINASIRNKMRDYSMDVCRKLQCMGYRGVLGMDFIEVNNKVFFIEINPRFQGSSEQLDRILKENKSPSLFEYNYYAFKHNKMKITDEYA